MDRGERSATHDKEESRARFIQFFFFRFHYHFLLSSFFLPSPSVCFQNLAMNAQLDALRAALLRENDVNKAMQILQVGTVVAAIRGGDPILPGSVNSPSFNLMCMLPILSATICPIFLD